MNELFSMKGRFNRQKYLVTGLIISVVIYAIAFGVGFAIGMAGMDTQIATAAGYVITFVGIIIWSFLVVKRLHDLGKPGWHYWLMYLPFYNIYLSIVLIFKKGITGPNQYGEDRCKA